MDKKVLTELSLFSGGGLGLLGSKLLEHKIIGYVEFNDYCQQVLKKRIQEGHLDEAPIFGDIRLFISEGFAKQYKGMVDVITAGFPCQPFSVLGDQKAEEDSRNMWPATIKCLCEIRPKFALLENVPGIFKTGYFSTILSDLAENGYDAQWMCLSAREIGANHKRERLFLLTYSNC